MNVTNKNFTKLLPNIVDSIKSCHFISFDYEMTGLYLKNHARIRPYDSVEEIYIKTKSSVESFIPIQLGVCTYKWNHVENKYIAKPFNFYLFNANDNHDFSFNLQTLDFLRKNNFDFNMMIEDGNPWISIEEYNKRKRKILERDQSDATQNKSDNIQNQSDNTQNQPDNTQNQSDITRNKSNITQNSLWIEKIFSLIDEWLHNDPSTPLVLNDPSCKSYYNRKVILNEIPKYNPKLIAKLEPDSIIIEYSTETDDYYLEKRNNLIEKCLNELDSKAGIKYVIEAMIESNKPLIGHNCFLDLCFLIQHFVKPLPSTEKEFSQLVHQLFPIILDTKLVASNHLRFKNLESTSLMCLNSFLQDHVLKDQSPAIELAEEFSLYSDDTLKDYAHQAGYDSYITGSLFLKIAYILRLKLDVNRGTESNEDKDDNCFESYNYDYYNDPIEIDYPISDPELPDSIMFKKFVNIIYFHGFGYNLNGKHIIPESDSNVFLTDLNPNIVEQDIERDFKKYGKFRIKWLYNNSAMLKYSKLAPEVLKSILETEKWAVHDYKKFRALSGPKRDNK